jgi:hypothetical protein
VFVCSSFAQTLNRDKVTPFGRDVALLSSRPTRGNKKATKWWLFAPQGGLFSNQFWDELMVYKSISRLLLLLF